MIDIKDKYRQEIVALVYRVGVHRKHIREARAAERRAADNARLSMQESQELQREILRLERLVNE